MKNAAQISRYHRAGKSGHKTLVEIEKLQQARAANPQLIARKPGRIILLLAAQYRDLIRSQRMPDDIVGDRSSARAEIVDATPAHRMVLLRAEGWRHYSRRTTPRYQQIAYLCGRDDNGRFARRVPGTCKTVDDALSAITPAIVQRAETVLRQGDVFVIPARRDNFDALPGTHRWDNATRTLTHTGGHSPLHVPFRARAVVQRDYAFARSNRD